MKLVKLDPRPPELQALIVRRRQLGVDLYDEVWNGSHHVVTAPNAQHFYARHGVEELLIADPAERTVAFWRRTSDERYELTPASALLGVSADHLTAAIDWPAPD